MTPEQIDLVWNNCQKNEILALDLTTVLQTISYSIEAKELTYFVSKMLGKSPSVIISKELDLMLGMGRKTNATDEALKENQARVIEFFWNYLFDASSNDYLNQSLATKALSALSELLRLSSVEMIITYFGRFIEKIRASDKSYFCVTATSQFLRLFFNKDNVTRASLVDSF